MKKYYSILLAGVIASSFLFANITQGAIQNDLKIKVDGVLLKSDVPPVQINDRSLVPIRAVVEKLGASVNWDEKTKKVSVLLNNMNIELKIDDVNVSVNGNAAKLDVPAKLINQRTMIPLRFVSEQFNLKVGWLASEKLVTIDHSKLMNIGCTKVDGKARLKITLDYFKNYNIINLSNPERLVIDFPNVDAPVKQQVLDINNGVIKSVRYAHFSDTNKGIDGARIVLDLTGQAKYEIKNTDNEFIMDIDTTGTVNSEQGNDSVSVPVTTTPTYTNSSTSLQDRGGIDRKPLNVLQNITYENKGDRVSLYLKGILLNEMGMNVTKFYREAYDKENKKYTITFSTGLGNVGTGTKVIDDELLSSIDVKTDTATRETSITFNAKNNFFYEVVARPDDKVNDTAITILKPAVSGEKLIVIDPGHGGYEPGAVYAGVYEKALNLDIALRLNELLKSKNIKTYIIRQDDSFVGLYERAYIANDLNAKLFVSIHNNAFNKSENGTETLYFPGGSNNGLNGQGFAQIVQGNLINALGTKNRGIVERPNLVVLKATSMPSVLIEAGFITNDAERAKLSTPEFKQKAAQALCDSIISALGKVN